MEKILSSGLLLILLLNACSETQVINPIQFNLSDNSNQYLPVNNIVSAFGVESDSIIKQIKDNTISVTNWGVQVKQLPVTKKIKKATLLSYLAFDNDKGSIREELKPVINTHEMAGYSDLLNQILLTDGPEQSDVKRYFIANDNNENEIKSPYVLLKREKNTADYRTLQAFIRWGFSTYKSEMKLLDINNHGLAFSGISSDETSGGNISLPELKDAIKTGTGKIDILNMDACLMSTIEVSYELKDVVDIIVASEDKTFNTGMLYAKHLPQILNKNSSNEELAKNILLSSSKQNVYTISLVKAKFADRFAYKLNTLSRMLLNKLYLYKDAIKTSFKSTHQLYIDRPETGPIPDSGNSKNNMIKNTNYDDIGQRDLYEVLARLEINIKDEEIVNAIRDARESLNMAVMRSQVHKIEKFADGMSINISKESVQSPEYKNTSFAKDTLWDELITDVYK